MSFSNTQETGRPLTIKDEGVSLVTNTASIDFVGAGVSGSVLGTAVTETISGGTSNSAIGEVPSGTIDSSNVTFTLAHTPVAGTVALFLNGARQKVTDDYTIASTTITFTVAPLTGSTLLADYAY